jgi:RNA polymerase sigma-70 factor (ECF subfamily)
MREGNGQKDSRSAMLDPKSRRVGFLYKRGHGGVCLGGKQAFPRMDDSVNMDWRERLYDGKAAELLLYGRALGLGESEAEDVVQETFVALLKLEKVPDNPEHYCVRAFRNRALNFKRGLWRRVARELESTRWFERSDAKNDLEEAAQRALAKLPVEQREVIILKIWHEMTYDEIATTLELSPNTVAGRYRYGMEKLKGILKGTDYERLDRATDESVAPPPTLPGAARANLCF